MSKGFISMVLHAHLPFVKHPEFDRYLEENWFFEALTETYIPLVDMLERLRSEGIASGLTISISPTLCAMLRDEVLLERYETYLNLMIELGDKELASLDLASPQRELAAGVRARYISTLATFQARRENLMESLMGLDSGGFVTLITTAATHAYLPVFQSFPQVVSAQISSGLDSFQYYLKKRPEGFWLPECGFYQGLEKTLEKERVAYTYVSSHGQLFAHSSLPYGLYAPLVCPKTGIHFFGRDLAACQDIWDAQRGYPTDGAYRDFHNDIGFYRDIEYLRGYIHEPGVRSFTGYKYSAVTSIHSDVKEVYNPKIAAQRVKEHVANFLYKRELRTNQLSNKMNIPPCFTITLDAELFGHWWHEGISWLEELIRETQNHETLSLVTAEQYIEMGLPKQYGVPTYSSWGDRGYAETWVDGSNDEMYRYLHRAIQAVTDTVNRYPGVRGIQKRAVQQSIKELFLAMSSDWAFLMKSGTFSGYASSRFVEHIKNCDNILSALSQWNADALWILQLEKKHNILPGLDDSIFLNPDHEHFSKF